MRISVSGGLFCHAYTAHELQFGTWSTASKPKSAFSGRLLRLGTLRRSEDGTDRVQILLHNVMIDNWGPRTRRTAAWQGDPSHDARYMTVGT